MNLVDPEGELPDFFWDVFNVGIGLYSLGKNLIEGNFADACVDLGGVVVDAAAAAIPILPGGVGTAIKAARASNDIVDAAKIVNKADDAIDAGKAAKTFKKGPDPNGGKGGKHGNADHDKAIDDAIRNLPGKAEDIRKNQVQVDINGNRVGNNRPDIQYNLNGQHYNIEVDRNLKNSQKHETVILKNDPKSKFNRIIIK